MLIKAAHINKVHDSMAFTNGVAVGAVHAIEAGFSGKQPKVLRRYINSMNKAIQRLKVKKGDTKADARTLFNTFTGMSGVMKEHRQHGRHSNKT